MYVFFETLIKTFAQIRTQPHPFCSLSLRFSLLSVSLSPALSSANISSRSLFLFFLPLLFSPPFSLSHPKIDLMIVHREIRGILRVSSIIMVFLMMVGSVIILAVLIGLMIAPTSDTFSKPHIDSVHRTFLLYF